MTTEIRVLDNAAARELYICVTPTTTASSQEQIEELFDRAAEVLRSHNAWIFQERIFCTAPCARVGIGPAGKGDRCMDLVAVVEPDSSIQYLDAGCC
jgi:hypothetical protein